MINEPEFDNDLSDKDLLNKTNRQIDELLTYAKSNAPNEFIDRQQIKEGFKNMIIARIDVLQRQLKLLRN